MIAMIYPSFLTPDVLVLGGVLSTPPVTSWNLRLVVPCVAVRTLGTMELNVPLGAAGVCCSAMGIAPDQVSETLRAVDANWRVSPVLTVFETVRLPK